MLAVSKTEVWVNTQTVHAHNQKLIQEENAFGMSNSTITIEERIQILHLPFCIPQSSAICGLDQQEEGCFDFNVSNTWHHSPSAVLLQVRRPAG